LNISKINYSSLIGKLIRAPLKLIPKDTVLPIIQGVLKGKKWIKGSSINGCWLGSYEYDKQLLFRSYVKKGMIVYDIGANVGFYTLLSSVLVGDEGKVFAFEPFPRNIKYLKKHVGLNLLQNVVIINKAVFNEATILSFKMGKNNSMGRLSENGELKVKTLALDGFVQANNLPPDLIKMDIEGGEYDALLGAEKILKQFKPVIFLATHGKDIHKKCVDYLKSFGYQLKSIEQKDLEETNEIIAYNPHSK